MHWLDTLSLKALKRTPVFQNGWGEVAPFAPLGELANTVRPASRVELTWGAPFTVRGLRVQDGVAPSPSTEVLPAALHTLHVRRILTPRAPKARVVVPPSWGDGGFGPRMWLVGALVARGLEPWLLEGAYFGARAAPLTRVAHTRTPLMVASPALARPSRLTRWMA